ncbi:MAG: carbohydrate-binding family 9-like protein, partial [Bacteroidota bacterium]
MTIESCSFRLSLPRTFFWALLPFFLLSCSDSDPATDADQESSSSDSLTVDWPFPCQEDKIPEYTVYRTDQPIEIDGNLDEEAWQDAPLSPRFIDLISGEDPIHDTHVKLLWDDDALYVGFLIEQPVINGTLTERNDPLYNENNAEIFIAGEDSYYEFEINALGTIYEAFFIWEEAYERGGFAENPAFARDNPLLREFNGVGWKEHPRGPRVGSWDFWFDGLETAV